ncbi:MAG: hypothetical protein Q8M98_11210 [Candidatus Cloacimonadaceae bacterium]|nr:hypothetical protein [Candidatus Cloacimonadaceae bacterium]MDP3115321.1 hypothetical protein [Candidatus Cloacimonadaceae bacterium]
MNKAVKTMLVLGGTALAGYFAYTQYKSLNNAVKLDKSLHTFLKNLYGEEPELVTIKAMNHIGIKAGFTKAVIEKYGDIESGIRDYVQEYYPALAKRLSVEIFAKAEEESNETV